MDKASDFRDEQEIHIYATVKQMHASAFFYVALLFTLLRREVTTTLASSLRNAANCIIGKVDIVDT